MLGYVFDHHHLHSELRLVTNVVNRTDLILRSCKMPDFDDQFFRSERFRYRN